jgi:hypothetical protein
VFSEVMTPIILKTHLLVQVPDDKLIGKAKKQGRYYVKSAYRLCVRVCGHVSFIAIWILVWYLAVKCSSKSQ